VQSLKVLVDRGDDPGSSGSARIAEWIEVLYDQALVAEGAPIEDPGGFARRITSLLAAVSKASAAAP